MILRVHGILEHVAERAAEIRVEGAGVSYQVMLPSYVGRELEAENGGAGGVGGAGGARGGGEITLHTLHYFETHGQGSTMIPRLIGFQSESDRAFFELFTTVKGVGARKALKALVEPPAVLAAWIVARDAKALVGLPEIGKRLAETIIAELHGKVDAYALEATMTGGHVEIKAGSSLSPQQQDAVGVLISLGQQESDARRRIEQAGVLLGADATAEQLVEAAFGVEAG